MASRALIDPCKSASSAPRITLLPPNFIGSQLRIGDSGDTLIANLTKRYAAIRTYRDRGVVRQALREGEVPIENPFETGFRRPGLFKCAFTRRHPYPPLAHVVSRCCHGADLAGAYSWVQHYEGASQLKIEKNLSFALGGAAEGAGLTIGGLLMPELGGSALHYVRGSTVVGRESFEDADCVIVEAPHPGEGTLTIWIDEQTLTLRKLVTKFEAFPPGEEIRRQIVIDGAMNDDELKRPA